MPQATTKIAWVGLACAHVLVATRRSRVAEALALDDWRPGRVKMFNLGGLLAWFVSAGVGLILFKAVGGTAAAWSSPITFGLSFGLYGLWLISPWEESVHLRRSSDIRLQSPDARTAVLVCAHCRGAFAAHEMDNDQNEQPICAECAADDLAFYRFALSDDRDQRAGSARAGGAVPGTSV